MPLSEIVFQPDAPLPLQPAPWEEKWDALRAELVLVVVQQIKPLARLRSEQLGLPKGNFPCPLCQNDLWFEFFPNGHIALVCRTQDCLYLRE
jgi:hypothetical protein